VKFLEENTVKRLRYNENVAAVFAMEENEVWTTRIDSTARGKYRWRCATNVILRLAAQRATSNVM
jgi:hypothetical protein